MERSIKNEPYNKPEKETPNLASNTNPKGKKTISIITSSKNFKSNLPFSRNFDEESTKGRFGWAQIMTNDIPYIFRNECKYLCFRMLEQKVLSKLFYHFYKELVSCANIKYVTVTKVEAGLLNEINSIHCNFQFGKERFLNEDLLLKLNEAGQLCGFLHCCYLKLENAREFDISKRCGFIRINRDSVVPYSVMNKQKCVPLFYFEGETEEMKQYTMKMENWDLAYLKFCCRIQGIRNDLISDSWCLVVSLSDLKIFFPQNTFFEEYWPGRKEPNRDLKQKGDSHTSYTLSSIYNMAINTFNIYDSSNAYQKMMPIAQQKMMPIPHKRQSSPSKMVQQKWLAIHPKLINISNDPTAPSPSNYMPSSVEYFSNTYLVYKLQHVVIEGKVIICINMKPNDMTDKWVTVMDLSKDFFYKIPVSVCEQVLDVLGIEIYKANTAQMRILRTTGRYSNEVLSLVQVDKVIQYLPQLTYMIRNILCKSQITKTKQLKQ